MKPTKAILMLPLFLLIALAAGASDEAMGSVTPGKGGCHAGPGRRPRNPVALKNLGLLGNADKIVVKPEICPQSSC